jgi:hypothetical protein
MTIDEILKEIERTLEVQSAAEIRLGRKVATAEEVLSYMLWQVEWMMGNLRTGHYTKKNGVLIYASTCESMCHFAQKLFAVGVHPAQIDWNEDGDSCDRTLPLFVHNKKWELNLLLVRPLPPGTTHDLNNKGIEFLPPFVRARLEYLGDTFGWKTTELFTYHEVQGKLSDGYYTLTEADHISPIHIRIDGGDECNRSLHVGGSSCWICPDSDHLYFDAIAPSLLSDSPDPTVWWCIQYEKGIKVIKILVCLPEEITVDFPDGV